MALRCASVGACENAGIVAANAAGITNAQSVAARIDVLII
jgi:hypothetical protein